MSHAEIVAIENAGRTAMAWSPEGYDGQTHFGSLTAALLPALFTLGVACLVMLSII